MRLAIKIASVALTLVATLVTASLREVTDSTYLSDVLQSSKHVLVEFISKDCDPCDSVQDRLESMESTYAPRLSIVSMNTAICQVSPSQFNIPGFPTQGLPALALFYQGAYVAGQSGDLSRSQIKTFLESNFKA